MIYLTVKYLFDNFFCSVATKMTRLNPELAVSVINWPPGSGSAIQDYGSTDLAPDPKFFLRIPKTEFGLELADLCVRCMRTKLKMTRCLVIS